MFWVYDRAIWDGLKGWWGWLAELFAC